MMLNGASSRTRTGHAVNLVQSRGLTGAQPHRLEAPSCQERMVRALHATPMTPVSGGPQP